MEIGALSEAHMESSVVASPVKLGIVTDHIWSDEEMTTLSRLLWIRMADQMAEMNKVVQRKFGKESKPKFKKLRKTCNQEDNDDMKFFTFRQHWIAQWSDQCGSFEDATLVHSMPFTYRRPPSCAYPCDTLQIFSIKVAGLTGGLNFPLDVFGLVAVRDCADRNRNLVFCRSRDNSQTLTEEEPYLALTGPSRAVVLNQEDMADLGTDVVVECNLKVRGNVESEDRVLSFLAAPVPTIPWLEVTNSTYTSKRSSLIFTFATFRNSVEATIFIQVIEGSWPSGVHGQITALVPSVGPDKLVLLDFGADDMPVRGNGFVDLSRQVVSVALDSELIVSCNAWKDDILAEQGTSFKCARGGGSRAVLQLDSCKLEILVAWSVVSPVPDGTMEFC